MEPSLRHLIHRCAMHTSFHGDKFESVIKDKFAGDQRIEFLSPGSPLNEYYSNLIEQYSLLLKNDDLLNEYKKFEDHEKILEKFTKVSIQRPKKTEKVEKQNNSYFIDFSNFTVVTKITNEMLSMATEKAPLNITAPRIISNEPAKEVSQTGLCPVCLASVKISEFSDHLKDHLDKKPEIVNDQPKLSGTARPIEEISAAKSIKLIVAIPENDSKIYNLKGQQVTFTVDDAIDLKEILSTISKDTLVPQGKLRLMYEQGGFVKNSNVWDDLLAHVDNDTVTCSLFVKGIKTAS